MTEYGITISGSGVAIERASDYQRILDTRWKTTSIVASVPFKTDDFEYLPEFTKILDHNLGYIPAFEAPFFNTTGESQSSKSGFYLFVADRTSIWFINGNYTGTPSVKPYGIDGYVNVYDINMEKDFESEAVGLVAAAKRGNIGMKLVGNNKYAAHDANDADPLGFSVSTDAKGIGISRVAPLGSGIIKHTLAYPPLVKLVDTDPYKNNFLVTIRPPSETNKFYGPLRLFGSSGVRIQPSQLVVTVNPGDESRYRYVMFRDPVEIAG